MNKKFEKDGNILKELTRPKSVNFRSLTYTEIRKLTDDEILELLDNRKKEDEPLSISTHQMLRDEITKRENNSAIKNSNFKASISLAIAVLSLLVALYPHLVGLF